MDIELKLLQDQKRQAIQQNDEESHSIQRELEVLQREFSKLKFERDNLCAQMEDSSFKDRDWQETVEQLNAQLEKATREKYVFEQKSQDDTNALTQKNDALLRDLKYLRQEQEKGQKRNKEFHEQILMLEASCSDKQVETNELQRKMNLLRSQINDQETLLKSKSDRVVDIETELQQNESQYFEQIKQLQ